MVSTFVATVTENRTDVIVAQIARVCGVIVWLDPPLTPVVGWKTASEDKRSPVKVLFH